MVFVTPKKKQSEPCNQSSLSATASKPAVAEPTTIELQCLYKDLSAAGKPVLLSLVPGYSDSYIPLYANGKPLTEKEFLELSYPDLLTKSEEMLASHQP